ncbi:MAG: tRNA (N6-threonylcarbamoyladenosine(37)-N6)-methyltransferase TrmO [Candidatus Aminicenantes bacterium]|nr:tRNA (N6-threonylcarbamoyladenosine(37)-N6)-methyltransferase TrmO [Candidatus Aminicenantes bacterium]
MIRFRPIGIVHSPFKTRDDIDPRRNRRPRGFADVRGEIEIDPAYAPGLKDIAGLSHLIIIFVFHKAGPGHLFARPPFERRRRGVFSTRSPRRPNPIGMTVVRLHGRRGNILKVSGIDMLEGTPVLDIKPYTSRDRKRGVQRGWMQRSVLNR